MTSAMQMFVREKTFYQNLVKIAVPIAAQNLVNFGVNMADTVMLGRIGDVQLAAATNATQLGFVFMLFVFGLGSGSNVLIAQYWGKGQLEPIHKVMTMMYRLLLVVSAVFTLIALVFPVQFMSIFSTVPQVVVEGAAYLRIMGYCYLISGITNATVTVLRSVGEVRIALVIYLTSLAVNVVLNYLLIFGRFGFPQMGVRGAALATCIARGVELVILIVYMVRMEKHIHYRLRYLFARKMGVARDYFRNAMPVVANELIWASGTAMIAVIIGRMGTEFTAANSVCTVLSQFVTIAIYGVGNAAAVIVGNTIGAGKYDTARQYCKTFLMISLLLGVVGTAIVLLVKEPLLGIYNISHIAKLYSSQIMTVYAGIVLFQSLSMTLLIGVMRGGGDTRFVLVADVAFLWVVAIPMGFLSGFVLGWPVWAVYLMIRSDEILKTLAAFWRMWNGNWIYDVTKN